MTAPFIYIRRLPIIALQEEENKVGKTCTTIGENTEGFISCADLDAGSIFDRQKNWSPLGLRFLWLPYNKMRLKFYQLEFVVTDCKNKFKKRLLFAHEFQAYQDRKSLLDTPQKHHVNPLRRALRWKAIKDQNPGMSTAMLAKRLGRSRVSATQYLNLLRLPDWIQEKVLKTNGLSERSLRPLIQIQNQRVLRAAFQEALSQTMSHFNEAQNGSDMPS